MEETTKWRATEYPVKIDEKITNMLVKCIVSRIQELFTSVEEIINIGPSLWQI